MLFDWSKVKLSEVQTPTAATCATGFSGSSKQQAALNEFQETGVVLDGPTSRRQQQQQQLQLQFSQPASQTQSGRTWPPLGGAAGDDDDDEDDGADRQPARSRTWRFK